MSLLPGDEGATYRFHHFHVHKQGFLTETIISIDYAWIYLIVLSLSDTGNKITHVKHVGVFTSRTIWTFTEEQTQINSTHNHSQRHDTTLIRRIIEFIV